MSEGEASYLGSPWTESANTLEVQILDRLALIQKDLEYSASQTLNMLIYVHTISPVHNICIANRNAKRED
jgi:hypothetical protein